MDLYIIGAGGYCSEVLWIVEQINPSNSRWSNVFIIEDYYKDLIGTEKRGCKIVGDLAYLAQVKEAVEIAIVINNVAVRERLINRLLTYKTNVSFPNLIDPSSMIDEKTLSMGCGNIIGAFVVLSTNLTIGKFNIINSYSGIGHDTSLGDFNTINPRVAISGNVSIGNSNNFGLNSSVLEKKTIGSGNEVWIHSCVTKNLGNNQKMFGVPAKKIDL